MLIEKLHMVTAKFEEECQHYPHHSPMSVDIISHRLQLFLALANELTSVEDRYTFYDLNEEIHYYKSQKPEFFRYGVFYDKLLELEVRKPLGQRKYYRKQYKILKAESTRILEHIIYYRLGGTDKDHLLFTKEAASKDINIIIRALVMLEKYLDTVNDKRTILEKISDHAVLKWTGTKTEYGELLQLLQSKAVINQGKLSITETHEHLSKVLGVEVHDIHKLTHEIMQRKEPAKFLMQGVQYIREKQQQFFTRIFNRK